MKLISDFEPEKIERFQWLSLAIQAYYEKNDFAMWLYLGYAIGKKSKDIIIVEWSDESVDLGLVEIYR